MSHKAKRGLRPFAAVALIAAAALAGCATPSETPAGASDESKTNGATGATPPAAATAPKPSANQPGSYSTDPGAAKSDPFGYDGRKLRQGLGN